MPIAPKHAGSEPMPSPYNGPERRRLPRLPVEAPIAILYPGFWIDQEPNSLLGTTANLSESGVCFTVNRRIPQSRIVLHIDYEGMGAEYVLGNIMKESAEREGTWRYHCQIERILSGVDPMSVFE